MLGRIRDALIKRNQLNDNFRNQNGYSWDYVITFKIYDEKDSLSAAQEKYSMKFIINQLSNAGIQTKLFYNYAVIL